MVDNLMKDHVYVFIPAVAYRISEGMADPALFAMDNDWMSSAKERSVDHGTLFGPGCSVSILERKLFMFVTVALLYGL